MKITDISSKPLSSDYSLLHALEEMNKTETKQSVAEQDVQQADSSWQKDILLDALSKLENSIHLDNIHPLDRTESAPIESFDEALIELSFIRTPKFLSEASATQANIKAEDVVSLFVE